MSEIRILAGMEVEAADKDALLALMRDVVAESRKETGCIQYDFVENLQNPLSFCVVETWASQKAIDEHNATPHFARLGEFFASHKAKVDIKLFKQII